MSTADGWDLTVPEDDAELVAEFRRHGMRAGQRLRVVPAETDREAPAPGQRRFEFAGSLRTDEHYSEHLDRALEGFRER